MLESRDTRASPAKFICSQCYVLTHQADAGGGEEGRKEGRRVRGACDEGRSCCQISITDTRSLTHSRRQEKAVRHFLMKKQGIKAANGRLFSVSVFLLISRSHVERASVHATHTLASCTR